MKMILSMNHTGHSSINIKYNAYDYENKSSFEILNTQSIVDSHMLKAEMHRIKWPKNDRISFEVLEEFY